MRSEEEIAKWYLVAIAAMISTIWVALAITAILLKDLTPLLFALLATLVIFLGWNVTITVGKRTRPEKKSQEVEKR